jgi:superfamily II DNA or RNA helicase
MSAFCSEAVIRKAADWRAFKQGSDLVAAVTDAVSTESGWRGAVRDGRRPLRVLVIARSATDMEVRCPCRENQSTGAFCAHAVAVGLALASGKPASATAAETTTPGLAVADNPAPPAAWDLEFPPPWRRMVASGKLAVRIAPSTALPDASDASITTWLATIGAPDGGMLQIDGTRLGTFLVAAADHPRISCGGEMLEITTDALLKIASVVPVGERVIITPEHREIRHLGHLTAEISENRISLITKPIPAALGALTAGNPAELPLRSFLEWVESLGDTLAWPDAGWMAEIHFVAAKPEISITIGTSGRAIDARPLVQYGDSPPVVPNGGNIPGLPELIDTTCRMRDRQAESHAVASLERHGFTRVENDRDQWQLTDEARIADFLNEGIHSLQSQFTLHHGPGLAKRIRDVAVISPKFEILGSGEDWLEFNLSFQTNDNQESIDPTEVWRLLKTGGGGKPKNLSRDLTEVIDPLFSELDLKQENGRFIARGASILSIKELYKYLSKTNNKNELRNKEFAMPSTLSAKLRPYQLVGAAWLVERLRAFRGALLADDMGLGKTIQTIAVIERLFLDCVMVGQAPDGEGDASGSGVHDGVATGSVLVVATTSLLGNWRAEFAKFAPGRRVRVLHGASRDAEKKQAGPGEVWLTSFGTLARDLAWYLRRGFLAVVVDEASLMRNPDTDHAKALFKLDAQYRIALSGTPVENGLRDLWSIFRFIQPGWLGGRREFQQRYEGAAANGDGPTLRRLRIKTAPFMLRRTKEEVAPELPTKILIDEFIDLTDDQQAVYRELLTAGRRSVEKLMDAKNKGAARMQMLTALLRMRQACCDLALLGDDRFKQMSLAKRSSKIERLIELIEEALSGNHKVLVFSQFSTQLHKILECMESRNIRTIQLDGTTRNRQELVDRFQSTDGPPVFLVSLKAGGYGLNLTAADVVIHFDPWWNPAAEAQATDRAHRIGQTRPVTVYRLLTRGTVEEKVVALQKRKRAIAAAIDEAGVGDAPGWSESDLAALLE